MNNILISQINATPLEMSLFLGRPYLVVALFILSIILATLGLILSFKERTKRIAAILLISGSLLAIGSIFLGLEIFFQ